MSKNTLMRKYLGYGLLSWPFIVVGTFAVHEIGWKGLFLVCGLCTVAIFFVVAGVWLIETGE